MRPTQQEVVQEILQGLEGLETLGQWELSLARELRTKTKALLKVVEKEKGAKGGREGAPDKSA